MMVSDRTSEWNSTLICTVMVLKSLTYWPYSDFGVRKWIIPHQWRYGLHSGVHPGEEWGSSEFSKSLLHHHGWWCNLWAMLAISSMYIPTLTYSRWMFQSKRAIFLFFVLALECSAGGIGMYVCSSVRSYVHVYVARIVRNVHVRVMKAENYPTWNVCAV